MTPENRPPRRCPCAAALLAIVALVTGVPAPGALAGDPVEATAGTVEPASVPTAPVSQVSAARVVIDPGSGQLVPGVRAEQVRALADQLEQLLGHAVPATPVEHALPRGGFRVQLDASYMSFLGAAFTAEGRVRVFHVDPADGTPTGAPGGTHEAP